MRKSLLSSQRHWASHCLVVMWTLVSCPLQAQQGEPSATYEVQIDGESFQVVGGQRPIRVESKLKKGASYTLAVRVAMTQMLRLNSVQLEYGMWAKVVDNKRKDLRIARIIHELGFSLEITDPGRVFDGKQQDDFLKTEADEVEKRLKDSKATGVRRTDPKSQKLGSSNGKWLRITSTDSDEVARTCMVFVLSGERYTVCAVCEFRDQDREDVSSWVMSALGSVRQLP
jgi:hypothetical protein